MTMARESDAKDRAAAKAIWRRNALVFAPLLLLFVLNFALAHLKIGRYALPATLGVAALQALITGLFFMELRQAKAIVRLAAATGLIWLAIMFALTFSDIFSRLKWGG